MSQYTKRVLKNGLTVLSVPVPHVESVTMSIFVKAGSRYEPARINGLSHFLEHLHFKGTKKYPTAKKLSEVVDSIGGEFNANTGKEHTQYFIRAASQHLPLVFEVLTDMLQNPLFDDKEMQREKGVIIEEINMYKDNPQIHIEALFEETLWPNTALGRDIAGTAEIIRNSKRKDIVDYRNQYYRPSNIIIAVSGKFDQAQLDEMIDKSWSKVSDKKVAKWEKVTGKQTTPRLSIENKKTEQAHMIVGFPAYQYGHKKNHILRLLAVILGGGMSSRLFIQIRERRGLAYYVGASFNNYLDTGNFLVQAGLKISSAGEALETILTELRKVRDEGVTATELKKAKAYIKGKVALGLESSHAQLDWHLNQEAFVGKIRSVKELFEQINKVTLVDIQSVAKEIIQNNKLNMALIGPFEDRKEFEKKLKI
jgi:predicted Zn-dependent peptidase